jgi:glycine/serine hydroxymethyltransferase
LQGGIRQKIDKAIFPGMQGTLMHIIAGNAVCFMKASMPNLLYIQ